MKRTNENIVSSYFYYMWNRWSKAECETVFGNMAGHFWGKWCSLSNNSPSGAAERLYAELSNDARRKIVERACELYDGQRLVPEKEEDESQIDVCECCGGRNIAPESYDDGWSTRTWCPDCNEEHYGTNLKEYKETINAWWDSLDDKKAGYLSQGAENHNAWWQSLSFDRQRALYKENFWEKNENDKTTPLYTGTQTPAHDPWRCSVCGSLSVECRTWSDANTGESAAGDDSIEFRCLDCENDNVIPESEYLPRVEEWWNAMDEQERKEIADTHFNVADHAIDETCPDSWQTCSPGQKIDIWREYIYPDCNIDI